MNVLKQIDDIVIRYNLDCNMTLKEVKSKILETSYICPKCKGKGQIYIEDGFGDGRTGDYYINCDLCNGEGRTKEEYKEKKVTVGYIKEIEENRIKSKTI